MVGGYHSTLHNFLEATRDQHASYVLVYKPGQEISFGQLFYKLIQLIYFQVI